MLGCQTTVTANTAWWLIAILFCVCTDKPHRVNLKALLDSHISFSPLNAGEQVKCPMQPPLNVAVSCHARGQTLPCLLQHRWWYLSRYLRQSGKTPSLVSRNSLKVVSRPLRVKIDLGWGWVRLCWGGLHTPRGAVLRACGSFLDWQVSGVEMNS